MDLSVGAEHETCSPPLYYNERIERRLRKGKGKKIVSITEPVQKSDYKLRKNKKKKNHNKIAKLRAARLKPITDELFSTEQHEQHDQVEPSFKMRPVTQRWWIVKNDDDDITPYSCVSSTPETRLLFRLGRGRERAVKRRLTGQHWIASDHWMNAML